jgi:hypothetical protein
MAIKYVQMACIWLRVKMADERGEFGMGAIISIAVGLIVTSFIILPSIKDFASSIMTDMQSWWSDSVSAKVFPE